MRNNSGLKAFLCGLKWWQKGLIGLFLLFLFVIFMDAVAMPLYTRHGDEYELPDVTLKPISEAMSILKDNGFIPILQDSLYSEQYAPGTVVQQNPAPLRKVKKGRRVYLIISSGERQVPMPDLITKTLTDAVIELQDRGMFQYDTTYVFSDSIEYNEEKVPTPEGTVIRQSVPTGEKVPVSKKVLLTVSMGPAPSQRVVPNLFGKSLKHALTILAEIHLPVGKIRHKVRKNLLPNTVIGQSVPPNTPLLDVASIDLVVSVDEWKEEPGDSSETSGTTENE